MGIDRNFYSSRNVTKVLYFVSGEWRNRVILREEFTTLIKRYKISLADFASL